MAGVLDRYFQSVFIGKAMAAMISDAVRGCKTLPGRLPLGLEGSWIHALYSSGYVPPGEQSFVNALTKESIRSPKAYSAELGLGSQSSNAQNNESIQSPEG